LTTNFVVDPGYKGRALDLIESCCAQAEARSRVCGRDEEGKHKLSGEGDS